MALQAETLYSKFTNIVFEGVETRGLRKDNTEAHGTAHTAWT